MVGESMCRHHHSSNQPGSFVANYVQNLMGNHECDERELKEAFNHYVVPEIQVLYRVAHSITRNATNAEALVQDTMLHAYRAIGRFDGQHPRAWLLTIMRNTQIDRVRRKRSKLMRDPDATMYRVASKDRVTSEDNDNADPEEQVPDQGHDAATESALEALAEKFRTVIELVDVEALSYREAAGVLGVPTSTIMSRLHRARTRIRKHLEQHGGCVNGRPA
jgi:RNA polymerase sigma-70 factor, ECF subfamily